MSVKTKAAISIVINVLMAVTTVGIVISYFFTKNFLIRTNQEIFWYFTTDSNLFVSLAALVTTVFDVQILRGKREILPKPVVLFKFTGVVAVMIVLMTCLLYLAPRYGFGFIFGSTFFHMHLSAPVMAFVSLCFFEKGERLGFWEAQLAHIPCIAYAVVYFVMVNAIGEANGGWRDLYHFSDNSTWYIAAILLTVQEIIIVIVTRLIYNLKQQRDAAPGPPIERFH